jgi:hypothetical protein
LNRKFNIVPQTWTLIRSKNTQKGMKTLLISNCSRTGRLLRARTPAVPSSRPMVSGVIWLSNPTTSLRMSLHEEQIKVRRRTWMADKAVQSRNRCKAIQDRGVRKWTRRMYKFKRKAFSIVCLVNCPRMRQSRGIR